MEKKDVHAKQGHRKIVKKMLKLAGKKSAKSPKLGNKDGNDPNSMELIFQAQNEGVVIDTTSRIPSTCVYVDAHASDSDTVSQKNIKEKEGLSGNEMHNRLLLDRSGNPANATQSTKILLDGKQGNLHIGQYYVKEDDGDEDV